MSGLYEQLLQVYGEEGFPLDTLVLMDLPSSVRRVVQLILRNKGEMTYPALCEAVDAMPEDRELSRAELDEILDALCRLDWLTREGEGPVTYTVNLGYASARHAQSDQSARIALDAQAQEKKPGVPEEWSEGVSGDLLTKGKPRHGAGRGIRGIWAALAPKSKRGRTSVPEEPDESGS
jgi:hypothetical protein